MFGYIEALMHARRSWLPGRRLTGERELAVLASYVLQISHDVYGVPADALNTLHAPALNVCQRPVMAAFDPKSAHLVARHGVQISFRVVPRALRQAVRPISVNPR